MAQPAPIRLRRPAGAGAAAPADCLPAGGACPASPLCLGTRVTTPHSVDRAQCLLRSSGSLSSLETVKSIPASPPAADALQAAIRELDARLPLADVLDLGPGKGYLVVRRQLKPAPSSRHPAPNSPAAAAPVAPPPAPAARAAWTGADEQRYQQSLAQLAQLVQLRACLWPRIQAWSRQQAALRALMLQAPQPGTTLQHLLRWAVVQRLRQLQQLQRQWQLKQAAPQPPELEASTVLLQLSRESATSQASQDPSSSGGAMPPPPPRPPRQAQQQHLARTACTSAVHSLHPAAQHSMCLAAAPAGPPAVRLQPTGQPVQVLWAPHTPRLHVPDNHLPSPPAAKRQRLAASPA